ncbi:MULTISPECIES: LysR family transcriptional regulator [unclassified Halomonas]|uniref:LysR family transcriptional regulator n=1 Tax=unclassified Halomonas TaxID=2609666 RepID=UPI00209E4035|nr:MULTISPECIES: LysR family transcriptional regulator [unclassified Halomonas]MCP1314089.1 LysR family transcriptional regulator [Halomonas sp. 707D7]MCP1325700.1 LysR family transcriptional regulator [Halomonas sp. 707D4]
MNLNHLKVFIVVAEQGSVLAASKALGVPNSTVARQLAQFEEQLGMQLVLRSTRYLRLTDEGKRIYAKTAALVEQLDEVENQITSEQGSLAGKITLAVPSEFGAQWLDTAIAEFAIEHPRVSIECITSMAPLDPVRRDIDVSIAYHRGNFEDSSLIMRKLLRLESVVVAAPHLIEKHGTPCSIKALERLPCISTLLALKENPWHFMGAKQRLFHVNVGSRYKVDSSRMLITGALKGIGYAIIPRVFCEEHIGEGRLVELELDYPPAPLEVVAIYPNRSINHRSRLLVKKIAQTLAAKFALENSAVKDRSSAR